MLTIIDFTKAGSKCGMEGVELLKWAVQQLYQYKSEQREAREREDKNRKHELQREAAAREHELKLKEHELKMKELDFLIAHPNQQLPVVKNKCLSNNTITEQDSSCEKSTSNFPKKGKSTKNRSFSSTIEQQDSHREKSRSNFPQKGKSTKNRGFYGFGGVPGRGNAGLCRTTGNVSHSTSYNHRKPVKCYKCQEFGHMKASCSKQWCDWCEQYGNHKMDDCYDMIQLNMWCNICEKASHETEYCYLFPQIERWCNKCCDGKHKTLDCDKMYVWKEQMEWRSHVKTKAGERYHRFSEFLC